MDFCEHTSSLPEIQGRIQYALDGGALIHRILWVRGSTYKDVCTLYTNYVRRKYGNAIIVFDGYEGLSTKDMTHQRRTKGRTGPNVTFTEDMTVSIRKDQFLANRSNKQRFINMLSAYLSAYQVNNNIIILEMTFKRQWISFNCDYSTG